MFVKKIIINNFRSISNLTIDCNNIDILIWGNDSWKSNILKALNLFFNNQTDFDASFSFTTDFNKFTKIPSKTAPEIKITIELYVPNHFKFPLLAWMKEKVIIWEKSWRKEGLKTDIPYISLPLRKKATFEKYNELLKAEWKSFARNKIPDWLRNINFRYIPAIKSNQYIQSLLQELYTVFTTSNIKAIEKASTSMIHEINLNTKTFSDGIKTFLGIDSQLWLPENNLSRFFEALDIVTEHNWKHISIHNRGDGIKTRHIPALIKFFGDTINENKPTGSIKNSVIWGYEEPENNLEILKAIELANEFISYNEENERWIQMFITTHSPAFYNIHKTAKNSKVHFVELATSAKTSVPWTYIQSFDNSDIEKNINTLNQRMWMLELMSDTIEKYEKDKKDLKDKIQSLEHELTASAIPLILTEWETDKIFIEKAKEKLGITTQYQIKAIGWSKMLDDILQKLQHTEDSRYIIGVFDRDENQYKTKYPTPKQVGANTKIHAFCIQNPISRSTNNDISIEYLFSDDEIKTPLPNGQRLFTWDEFHKESWQHKKYLDISLSMPNKRGEHKIIDDNVYQKNTKIVASKNKFAEAVRDEKIHISDESWKNFQHIFDNIEKIINPINS